MADKIVDPGDLDTPSPDTPEDPNPTPKPDRQRGPDGRFTAFAKHVGDGETEEVPSSQHPISLVEEARDFGFDDDDIEDMSTPVLHKTLWKAKRQIEQARQKAYDFQARESQRVNIDPRQQPRREEPAPEPEDDFDLGIDEEELHPKVIQAMKKLGGSYKKEIKALRGELDQQRQRDRERGARRSVAMIDAAFAQLPEFEKLYGKGTGGQLGPDSAAMKRRLAVLRQAGVNANDPVSVGELRRQIKEATEELFAPVLGDEPNPYATEGEAPRAEKPGKNGKSSANGRITREQWNDATLARPTQRRVDDKPKTSEERTALAVANLTAKLRGERGDNISDADELDGFPD